jgi:hypothetical protein
MCNTVPVKTKPIPAAVSRMINSLVRIFMTNSSLHAWTLQVSAAQRVDRYHKSAECIPLVRLGTFSLQPLFVMAVTMQGHFCDSRHNTGALTSQTRASESVRVLASLACSQKTSRSRCGVKVVVNGALLQIQRRLSCR